ncbi:hypothetical protein Q0N12_01905 [Rossellomorea marisflavi]|uniref:hypothetical protein n=1 Tax=Rossellomorea TaxID=2837508 RepID=UPI000A4CE9D4|nr:hypothetical protein [Rossellomorea marisflavi]MBV6683494.1 hypothetical protein [Bacillus sp. JRC01]VXB98200.1 conserved hypothetical protein [Bacillus sp. 349Y]MCM2590764.1 hypothetical protein [Rossellomorea marisflavi]MDR4936611.1 hypothetical protein [Rossellomorea marisflavi]MDW4527047.1 hypothetical protein [Rossellomorea marisflavi]
MLNKALKVMERNADEVETTILKGMQWVLRFILISFMILSVPMFLYLMWMIPSL